MPRKTNPYTPDKEPTKNDLAVISQRLTYFRTEYIGGQKAVVDDGIVSMRTLSRIENGEQYPSQKYLTYLSTSHKMSIEWALSGKGSEISSLSNKKDTLESLPAKVALLEREVTDLKATLKEILAKLKEVESD
jgi:transcriptional regulator with XRE-family HTH domain